jgi:hypothetical protein
MPCMAYHITIKATEVLESQFMSLRLKDWLRDVLQDMYIPHKLLTKSMEQSPSWEADSHSVS